MRSAPFWVTLFYLTDKLWVGVVNGVGDFEIDEASAGKVGGVVSLSRNDCV